MNYLLDQGIPRSTVDYLLAFGIRSQRVGDIGLATASDAEILQEGRRRGAVIVTLDADFHALLALQHAKGPSVIRIRIEGMKGQQTASVIFRVHQLALVDLEQGAAISVTEKRIAIRRLPLGG